MMSKRTNTKPTPARKLAANRANAQKSTGPKTPEGKDRSRMNALKHGLRAGEVVLPDDLYESPEDFDDLRDALTRDIQPANMVEMLLVERLTVAHWRLRRACRHETCSTYDLRTRQETDPVRNLPRDLGLGHGANLPDQLPAAFQFDQLLRYEAALNRTINQIFRQLIQLRTAASLVFPGTEASDQPTFDSCPPESQREAQPHGRRPDPARSNPPSSCPAPSSSSIPAPISAQTNPTPAIPDPTQPPATKDLPEIDPPGPPLPRHDAAPRAYSAQAAAWPAKAGSRAASLASPGLSLSNAEPAGDAHLSAWAKQILQAAMQASESDEQQGVEGTQ